MNCFSIGFGLFFILMGVGMLLKAFGIDLPIARVALALIIIFLGLRMLLPKSFRGHCESNGRSAAFSETHVKHSGVESADYNVVFGSQKIDLTKVDLSKGNVKVDVNAAFGSAEVTLDPKTPAKIVGSAVFGNVEMPGGNSAAFGTSTYKSETYKEGSPALLVDANAAFGGIKIR